MSADPNKDYYATLGVLPDADLALIKAAYRALAKKFHPDTGSSDNPEVKDKFIEIQEAYEVLKDADKRRQYDALRKKAGNSPDDLSTEGEQEDVDIDIDEAWQKLVEQFPDLDEVYGDFRLMSVALANSFQLTVVEAKDPATYPDIAKKLEKRFLWKYFGRYVAVQELAKRLLLHGRKSAARRLNKEAKATGTLSQEQRDELVARYEKKYLKPDDGDLSGAKRAAEGETNKAKDTTGPGGKKAKSASRRSTRNAFPWRLITAGFVAVVVAWGTMFLISNEQVSKEQERVSIRTADGVPARRPLSEQTVEELCAAAIDPRTSSWQPWMHVFVDEAKRRNLSENDCLIALGLPSVTKKAAEPTQPPLNLRAEPKSSIKLVEERLPNHAEANSTVQLDNVPKSKTNPQRQNGQASTTISSHSQSGDQSLQQYPQPKEDALAYSDSIALSDLADSNGNVTNITKTLPTDSVAEHIVLKSGESLIQRLVELVEGI